MSQRPSPPKTAMLAATLLLLAAGLVAYYLHQRAVPAPAHAVAPAAQSAAPRSKAQASMALMALPELKAWSGQIEKNSGGTRHGALIEYDPKPRTVNGKRYWQFSFVENGADAARRIDSFLVAASGDEILVEDGASDDLLSLERWRKEKQPLARVVGAPP